MITSVFERTRVFSRIALAVVATVVFFVGGLVMSQPTSAAPGINEQINFQGRLFTSEGATVPDGVYNLQFKLYQDGAGTAAGNPGGTLEWTENHLVSASDGVTIKNGYLSVQLGSVNPFGTSVDWNQDTLWLSINIGDTTSCTITTDFDTDCGGDGEMLPMKRLSSTPFSLNSARLGGRTADEFIQNGTTLQTANVAIQSADASDVTALIQGAAGQTADIFQVNADSVGTPLLAVSNAGSVTITPTSDATPALSVNSTTGSIFTATSTQINLNQNTVLATGSTFTTNGSGFDGSGNLGVGTTAPSTTLEVANSSANNTQAQLLINNTSSDSNADATTEYKNNNKSYYVGVDTSDSSSFKISSSTATGSTGGSFGKTGDASSASSETNSGNFMVCSRYTAPVDGTLASISVHWQGTLSGGEQVQVALYEDSSNVPGALISSSSSVALNQDNWTTVPLTPSVVATTDYWLCANTNATSGGWSYEAPTGGELGQRYQNRSFGTWTDPFGTSNIDSGRQMFFYATYAGTASDTYADYLLKLTDSGQATFKNSSDSTNAFAVQNASGADMLSVDTTNTRLQVGSATDDNVAIFFMLDNYNQATDPAGTDGAMYYNTSTNKFRCYQDGAWLDCIGATAASYALDDLSNLASTNINAALNATANDLTLQTTTSGNIVLNAADSILLQSDTTISGDVVLDAGNSLRITGGNTASRPAAPTEGMVYFDTDATKLITYANGKWQADRSEGLLVAADNSGQNEKDAADYVADGTSDQTEINAALSAAAGRKVTLLPGTYVVDGAVVVPNNTTLSGTGPDSVIELADLDSNINAIQATGTNRTGQVIRDLRLDGRKDLNTAGTQHGINFNGSVGTGSGATARKGGTIQNVVAENFRNYGLYLSGSSANNTLTGNTARNNDAGGIFLNVATNNTISDNTLLGNHTGIYIYNSSTGNIVTGNALEGNYIRGIYLDELANNNVIANNTIEDSGGTTTNRGIILNNSDYNRITANTISDTQCDTDCFAIDINSTSDYTYLEGNIYSDTDADDDASINDAGTGTIYAGQQTNATTSNNDVTDFRYRGSADSTTAFAIQNAAGDSILNLDTTNMTAVINNGTGTANILDVQDAGTSVLAVADGGAVTLQNQVNSDSAFAVNNNLGNTLFSVDTDNSRVVIGPVSSGSTASARLYFGDVANVNNLWIGEQGGTDSDILQIQGKNGVQISTGTTADPVLTINSSGTTLTSDTVTLGSSTADTTVQKSAQTTTNTSGASLRIQGATGSGTGAGGVVTIQGGTGGATNGNGGNLVLSGGNGTGSGVDGLVVLNTPTFSTTTNDANCYTGGALVASSCTIALTSVNSSAAIIVGLSSADQTVTLPDPTILTAGRVAYITAASNSQDFALIVNGGGQGNEIAMRANTTATMIWSGSDWTAAGASSSTTLQAAYNNTLSSAGGAEIVLNNTPTSNGLTVRNSASNAIIGGIFEAQTSIGSNLFSVNNNATEFATNGGAETLGATASTFPANSWDATTAGTVDRWTTLGDNIATGAASVRVQTTGVNHGARNRISTPLTSGLTYSVSFAVRGATNFNTLDVRYSPDGTTSGTTQCTTAEVVTSGIWTRINCTFIASGAITANNSMLIRQTDGTTRTFYIDNLSITINASATYAADGSVDNAGAFGTNWTAYGAGSVAARDTAVIYDSSASARVNTTNDADRGIRNNLAIVPATNTQYLVSFYARSGGGAINDLTVRYSRDGGTSFAPCVDYNTQAIDTSGWTKITCLFTTDSTTASNADLIITQAAAPGGTRSIYVDALSITLNTNNANNVQIGGANKGGPTTLLTLDRSDSPPIAANNEAYLGSMYYDTTTGRIQCYEADGWGACGSAPDNIVNLSPEYAGAVLNGSGVGTMTADLCANESGVLQVNNSLCGAGESKNFYRWTSPQATQQTYSIYVSYQLPTTFKAFSSDDTVQLTARVDNTTNAAVTYEMFRSEGGALTQCGSGETAVTTAANTWQTVGINGNEATGCGFNSNSGGAYVLFKINVKANSNANAFVSTLSFVTTGK